MDEQYILFEMLLNVEIEIRALSEFNAVDKFCKKSTYAVYLSTFLCLRISFRLQYHRNNLSY
jgi:hypothetical protein